MFCCLMCLFCLNCTKFGQLNLTKIIATRCQILRLKCTKFDFGWGSAPDSAGGAYSAPTDPLAGGERACCPSKELHPALDPSGFEPWPSGRRSRSHALFFPNLGLSVYDNGMILMNIVSAVSRSTPWQVHKVWNVIIIFANLSKIKIDWLIDWLNIKSLVLLLLLLLLVVLSLNDLSWTVMLSMWHRWHTSSHTAVICSFVKAAQVVHITQQFANITESVVLLYRVSWIW